MAATANPTPQVINQVLEVSKLLNSVVTISTSRIPVLLVGPRGTGIDLLARAIHACSPREARAFITIRCRMSLASTIAKRLLGRAPSRSQGEANGGEGSGYFTSANSGTLFLDQIQNTSPQIQSELLRVISDGQYLDSEGQAHRSDVRLIVSAWHDLREHVEKGRFRADLYERLSRVSLELRKGASDQEYLLQVVEVFRGRPSAESTEFPSPIPEHVLDALKDYPWPEEVASLKYTIRETALQEGPAASAETVLLSTLRKLGHLRLQSLVHQNLQAASAAIERCVEAYETFDGQLYDTLLSTLQRTLIERVMVQCNGTLSRAADMLGVSTGLLQTKLRELKLGNRSAT